MRTPIIAGNWKMHKTIAEGTAFVDAIRDQIAEAKAEAVLCAPFTLLPALKAAVAGTKIKVGAQNMHFAQSGAFTGEISAEMLVELEIDYVIIGHSERRELFNETDDTVNRKTKAALAAGIIPIVCCGETLAEREAETTFDVVEKQIVTGLADLTPAQVAGIVIAYEPIWAIGTGKTASAADANEVNAHIRNVVAKTFGKEAADKVRIQYGGSVKPANVKEIMAESDIDGALVGGASLTADSFTALVQF